MRHVSTALTALVLAALVPASACAAGFTTPRTISPAVKRGGVDTPLTAVAPNGRTAVLWRTFGEHTRDFQYYAALGASPASLGQPTIIPSARASAGDVGTSFVLARPDGGFVACFANDPRKGDVIEACTIAPPGGGFGAAHVIRRIDWKLRPQFDGVMQADGRVVFTLTALAPKQSRTLQTATMDGNGTVSAPQYLDRINSYTVPSLAATSDGTVGVAYIAYQQPSLKAPPMTTPKLRILAPGGTAFGPNVAITTAKDLNGGVTLYGGRDLLIGYSSGQYGDDTFRDHVVRRLPDGTFAPELTLASAATGGSLSSLTQLADGTPLAITTRGERSGDDCSSLISGEVQAEALPASGGPATSTLSTAKQIAIDPLVTSLTNGTAIVVWHDSSDEYGDSRLEAAVRTPTDTAFQAPQVLPNISTRDVSLAAGGDEAVLAWTVGSVPSIGGASHLVVSSLASTPPYAPPTTRPKHPAAPCE